MRAGREKRIVQHFGLLTAALALGVVAGCKGPGAVGTMGADNEVPLTANELQGYDDIARISLLLLTPLEDIDTDGVPDGARVRLYLYRTPGQSLRPVFGRGDVTFNLVQRTIAEDGGPVEKRLKSWSLTPAELSSARGKTRFGDCYQVEVYWGELRDFPENVYLRAEFLRLDNRVVRSRLVSVPAKLGIPARGRR